MRALRDVYTALADDARQEAMSPAADWLLDNFHIISAAARDIQSRSPGLVLPAAAVVSPPTSSPGCRAFTRWRSS